MPVASACRQRERSSRERPGFGRTRDRDRGRGPMRIAIRINDCLGVYADMQARHPKAAVVVPPCVGAVLSDTAETAPTQRDRHLQRIAETGRLSWQRDSGYNLRALVEAQIGRFKRVIGNALVRCYGGVG